MRSLMPSLAKKSGPKCGGTFWKVPQLETSYLHATSVLQHASAVHFGQKGAKHQHSSHIIHPTARVSSRSCAAALQKLKPINSCGKLI